MNVTTTTVSGPNQGAAAAITAAQTAQTAAAGQMLDLLCTVMVLCRGKLANGKPFWAYMCIKPSKAKAFGDARKSGRMNLMDFGSVIEAGEGENPPEDVKLRMEREFGMRHDNDEQLLNMIKKQNE
jgi:hypothetical protein